MITAIVQFNLPASVTPNQAREFFSNVAPHFRDVPGLIRKYFLLSEDGSTAGGAYLWETREDAQRFYGNGFRQSMIEQFGCEPFITYFETPVVVDNNLIGEAIAAR